MKKFALCLFVFAAWLPMLISCAEEEVETIEAPTVQAVGNSIIITSAPIKDESFLANITYANIFRCSTTNTNNPGDISWESIGQVVRTDKSAPTAFSFEDPFIQSTEEGVKLYYQYYIRYRYKSGGEINSAASVWVNNASTDCLGEVKEITIGNSYLVYYRNDKTLEYILTLYNSDEATAENFASVSTSNDDATIPSEHQFAGLYVIFFNGTIARPILLESLSISETASNTFVAEYDDANRTALDMQRKLPEDFFDVTLSGESEGFKLIALYETSDVGKTYTNYYWTPVSDKITIPLYKVEYTLGTSVSGTKMWQWSANINVKNKAPNTFDSSGIIYPTSFKAGYISTDSDTGRPNISFEYTDSDGTQTTATIVTTSVTSFVVPSPNHTVIDIDTTSRSAVVSLP